MTDPLNRITRLAMPLAYGDPAFTACLHSAMDSLELMQNFDRLYGARLTRVSSPIEVMIDKATGKSEDDLRAFLAFVHDTIYLRIPDEAILSLRAAAALAGKATT